MIDPIEQKAALQRAQRAADIRAPVVLNGSATRVKFAGANTGVCSPGALLISDPVDLGRVYTPGESIHVRTWTDSTWGAVSHAGGLNNATATTSYTGEFYAYWDYPDQNCDAYRIASLLRVADVQL